MVALTPLRACALPPKVPCDPRVPAASRSNTVAPGAIETDFLGGAVRGTPGLNQQFAGITALGRVGMPDDIGPMIASLLGESNRWINAQRIEVSGGQGI